MRLPREILEVRMESLVLFCNENAYAIIVAMNEGRAFVVREAWHLRRMLWTWRI